MDTSFTSTDEEENEEKITDEPEDQQAGQNGSANSQKLPEPSPKKTEAPQRISENSQKTSDNSHELPKKSMEASKKSTDASQKSAETTQKSPEASKKPMETSEKSTEASLKLPETSKKSTETSPKSSEALQKSPEPSQKSPGTKKSQPKDSPKNTEKNQDKGKVQTVGAKTQNEELLLNGEMKTISKDENVSKVFIDDEKKSVRSNIPTNLPGPTSPDHRPTDKKDSPNQSTKAGKTSPKKGD